MDIRKQVTRIAAVAALGLLAAGSASATYLTHQAAAGNHVFGGAAQVPLLGMTSVAFANAANQRFVVIFSAECAVTAPAGNMSAWTDIDIVVLNAAGAVVQTLAPTLGNGDAFCSSNGSAAFDGWSANSVTAVGGVGLAAGVYQVQVRGRLNNGAINASYGDRSLVIMR